jgi:hypothetical protein
MKVTKEEFALWVNATIAKDKLDDEQIKLPNGYYVTMSARCKYACLKKSTSCYGNYDFWRFNSIDSMIDEIWIDFVNSAKYDSDDKPYCKAGRVELTYTDCDRIARHGKLIVAYRDIYKLHWSNAQGRYYASKVYHSDGEVGITKRGRWIALTATEVNRILGFDLFATETIVKQKILEAMERLKSLQPV